MKNSLVVARVSIGLCLLALAGCAGTPTPADLMRQQATDVQAQVDLRNQLADDWEKGEKLVATGEKRIEDGEKRVQSAERDLKRGQDDIERGRREIADGQTLINESEEKFRENFQAIGVN